MADTLPPIPEKTDAVQGGKITADWLRWLNALKQRAEFISTTGSIDASQVISGVLDLARIPNIPWAKVLKAGSSLADLAVRSASDLSSGILALARGGTASDLSATGGAGKYLKQTSAGAPVSVASILEPDLPTGINANKIADGSVSNTEYQFLDGAVMNLQEQINKRQYIPLHVKNWSYWPSNLATPSVIEGVNVENATVTANTRAVTYTAGFYGHRFDTAAAAGNVAFINGHATSQVATVYDPTLYFRIKTGSDISNINFQLGISSGPGGVGANIHQLFFRFLAGTDTGWVGSCCDGAGANTQITSQVAAIAANTEYLLRIRVSGDGTSVGFSVNNGTEQTLSTHLPGTTQSLALDIFIVTNVNAVRSFVFNSVYCQLEEEPLTGGPSSGIAIDASQIVSGIINLARISGLTNAQIDAAAAIAWSKISKSGSSLADLATRSAADLSSGVLATARGGTSVDIASAALPLGSGQITFPATQNPSAGANTLDDYEEGGWTPIDSSGAGLSLNAGGSYVKIGKIVLISAQIIYPATANGANALIGGLPFTVENANHGAYQCFGVHLMWLVNANGTTITPLDPATNATKTNAQMSGTNNVITGMYRV